VQIEVLAVLDPVTSDIRLRACDPMQGGDRLVRRRFHNILRPLEEWVHTDSKIMTDFTVDKRALNDLGYNHVVQSAFAGQNSKNMNNFHMEFLRKSVWAMFQKTMLSLLGRHMIQQFLDELIWRETYGGTSKRAFDNIIRHIAEQTKFDLNNNLINRLAKIASNPFHDWSYTMTHSAGDILEKRGRKRIYPATNLGQDPKKIILEPKDNTEKEEEEGAFDETLGHDSTCFDIDSPCEKRSKTVKCQPCLEYLYNLLSDVQRNVPVLILCNKQDQTVAKGCAVTRTMLEKEMNLLRMTKTSQLEGTDASSTNVFLGKQEKDLEFSHFDSQNRTRLIRILKHRPISKNLTTAQQTQNITIIYLRSNT
ncbi:hypothetical protein DMN91_012474, partial [Ooceraea biroi]